MYIKSDKGIYGNYGTRKTESKNPCYRFVIGFLNFTRLGFRRYADKSAQFIGMRIRTSVTIRRRNAFPNIKPVDNLRLTKRNALELAKYAGLVGLTPKSSLTGSSKISLPTSGTIVMTTGTPKRT